MEVAPCAQEVRRHAALLLAYLNIQRKQGQFCDLVLRQRQNPGQLYPAHRCVLAASSPVLASVLSSAGALVELQAPCLSDSVLAPLLDYVYTGDLPYTYSQQQYYSLLTAACYLQMDELQKALRARQQTEVCAMDSADASAEAEKNTYRTTVNTSPDIPSISSILTFRGPEETDNYSVQSMTTSPERESHQYSDNMEPFNETQMHSAAMDCSTDEVEMDTARNRRDHNSGRHARTLSNPSTPCGILERTESSLNAGHDRQETYLKPQHFTLNVPSIAEVHDLSEVDKEVENDQFNPAGIWQRYTDNTLVRAAENRKSSSSSPHPYCGAVPVICHSGRAPIPQLVNFSAVPPDHLSPQASGSSSRSPVSRSASTDNGSIVEGISSKYKCQYQAQIQECGHSKKHTVTQSLDNKDSLNQCALQDLAYKSGPDRSNMLKQDYNSSDTHNCIMHNECADSGSSHITDHNDQHAHCDSFQNNIQNFKEDSVSQNKDRSQELKYKTDFRFDDCPAKQKRLDFFEFFNVPLATATEEPGHLRAEVPLTAHSVEDSNTANLGPEGEVKEEHSYSSRNPAETNIQNSHCNLYEPKKNRYSIIHRADTSATDAASSHDSNYRPTTVENKEDNVDFFPTSLESEKLSGTDITESRSTFTMPLDRNMSDTSVDSVVGHSYHGHLHYHCLQQDDLQEDVHLSHEGSHHKHSSVNYFDDSDDSSDDEAFGAFESPMKQHYSSTDTTDQFLLLDISTRPAELLVAHKHRSCTEEKFETGIWAQDRAKRKEETSLASVEMKTVTARAKFGTERFDMVGAHWAAKTHDEERKSVQNSPGVETIQNLGAVWDVSSLKEGENQTSTSTHCSPPSVSNSVQASMSVCMPSALSSSMPTDRSAYLSTPVHHPFQCSLCDRSFSQRGSLNRHVRSHLGVRPFPCPRCPMTFSRQYRVTEHMRVHQRCAPGNDFQKPPASST